VEQILDPSLEKVLYNHAVRIARLQALPTGCEYDDNFFVVVDDEDSLPPDLDDDDIFDDGNCYIIEGTIECITGGEPVPEPCLGCTDVMGSPLWETSP
jgi:hypothetical protein